MENIFKLFVDTNIIMEYFAHRKQYTAVRAIFRCAEAGSLSVCTSMNSIATAIYLMGVELKNQGVHEPDKREEIRDWLKALLGYVDIIDISRSSAIKGLSDLDFIDLEDSLQYYCALENRCDCLITINLKHFKKSNVTMEVLDPKGFASKYLELT